MQSEPLVVKGTMQQLITKLDHLLKVVRNREATGWPALMSDEQWVYHTEDDERVCPICAAMDGHVFTGPAVPEMFPFYQFQMAKGTLIFPHVHKGVKGMEKIPCRCRLELPDVADVLEKRLHEDKRLAVQF